MTLPIEEALEGKYEILEKIGEGGIGSVYKVKHRLLDEIRVIKVLRPQFSNKEDHQERFLHEARMAIRLKHPNVAQLHDFSISDDGTAFIVMEFIDGIALDALLTANGPPSLDMSLEISRQALRALGYLHAHELVHRDVSPDNIMLTTSFDGGVGIKLIDLGIAKNLAEESGLTQTGVFLGKVRYCSPEQFSSTENQTAELDSRSDLYSFGLLLYELLTGVYPFGGKTFAELAGCHLFQPPISFDESDPEGKVPEELRNVILKALEKDPDARFASAAEFASQLEGFGDPQTSIEEELSQTVERTTFTIQKPGDYQRQGSTQDRLNAQFGMGKTGVREPLTASKRGKAKAAKVAAGKKPARATSNRTWIWAAGIGAALLLTFGAIWFATSRGETIETADASQPAGDVMKFEPTESFARPEAAQGIDFDSLEVPAPPGSVADGAQAAKTDPEKAREQEPARGQSAEGDRRLPPPRQPPAGSQSSGEPPPRRPGPNGPPIAGRTAEIYQPGVGVIPPVLVQLAPTIYADGKRPRNEITFQVEVLVDEFGKVLTARASGGGVFKRRYRDDAVETAKRSRFRPAVKEGVTGRMWTTIPIVFEAE